MSLNELQSLLGCALPFCGEKQFDITLRDDGHIIASHEDEYGNRWLDEIAPDGTIYSTVDYSESFESMGCQDVRRAQSGVLDPNKIEQARQILITIQNVVNICRFGFIIYLPYPLLTKEGNILPFVRGGRVG